jgi:membrane associated rhomboid family serine protease
VESWAKICPRCEYEWPVLPVEAADLHFVEFGELLRQLTPRFWATPLLIGLNLTIFLVMLAKGVHFLSPTPESLVRWGADFGPLTISGQWWRLLTATFLHAGIIHLFFNMYVLWDIGSLVERLVGNGEFLVLYLLSGIAGSLLSSAWHPAIVSVGASGAVFGLFGVMLAFLLRHRSSIPGDVLKKLRNSTLAFLGYNVLFGLRPGIDMAAHFGGLFAGFACGWFAVQPLTLEGLQRRRRAIFRVLAAAGGMILAGCFWLPDLGLSRVGEIQSASLRVELSRFNRIEFRSLRKAQDGLRQYRDGTLADFKFAELIDSEVLPEWRQCRLRLSALQGLEPKDSAIAKNLGRYMELRETEWTLLVESIREQDGAKANQAVRVHGEAEKMAAELAKAWNPQ